MENERNKPDCPLIGQDGNVFNLIGMASRTLKDNGMAAEASEMSSRVFASGSYDETLRDSMPSYKSQDGSYKDICFPTTPEFRQQLNNEIIGAYHQTISQLQEQKNIPVSMEADEQSAAMGMAM